MDLIGFGPRFGPYHHAEIPSYKRVKWGRLTGPSHMGHCQSRLSYSLHSYQNEMVLTIYARDELFMNLFLDILFCAQHYLFFSKVWQDGIAANWVARIFQITLLTGLVKKLTFCNIVGWALSFYLFVCFKTVIGK